MQASGQMTINMLQVQPIKAFSDNYIWLLTSDHSQFQNLCWVVDPGDGQAVIDFLSEQEPDLTLVGALITHHHPDHVGGLPALSAYTEKLGHPLEIIGPDNPSIPAITVPVVEDQVMLVLGHPFQVIEVPGHTLDHIAFYWSGDDANAPVLFCGDTLFAGGCGRLFEGTPEQMWGSLQKLARLSKNTQLYCAHEYTSANLAFACEVEPNNQALAQRVVSVQSLRVQNLPSVPSQLSVELDTNPFLRSSERDLARNVATHCGQELNSEIDVFAATRAWKDNF